jgi:hypothetical protein
MLDPTLRDARFARPVDYAKASTPRQANGSRIIYVENHVVTYQTYVRISFFFDFVLVEIHVVFSNNRDFAIVGFF